VAVFRYTRFDVVPPRAGGGGDASISLVNTRVVRGAAVAASQTPTGAAASASRDDRTD